MSEISNCLRMLNLLKTRGLMSIKDLADTLEVKPRTIRKYKADLEMAGVYIESKRGKYGGYYIGRDTTFIESFIEKKDIETIVIVTEYLKNRTDYLFMDDVEALKDKMLSVREERRTISLNGNYIINNEPKITKAIERNKYFAFEGAIYSKNKVLIEYNSISKGLTRRVIRPLGLFSYKDFWYCVAFCEERKKIRDFKLIRVEKYKVLEEKFKEIKDFDINNYIGEKTIFKSKFIDCKIEITKPLSQDIAERRWSENQSITYKENGNIIIEARFEDSPELINWLLSISTCIRELEPVELKDKLKGELDKIRKNIQ